MEFGEWVQNIRKAQELDVRSFAEKTGVDSSTISRTENRHTQTTLYTAFRISEGMGVSLPQLLEILEGKRFPALTEEFFIENSNALTLQGLESIINRFHSDKESVKAFLANQLNNILDEIYSDSMLKRDLHIDYETIPYNAGDIERMLLKSPLSNRIDLKYPSLVRPDTILYAFQGKGALMLRDVEMYLNKGRFQSNARLTMLSSLRIRVPFSIERIKFSDVLQLDMETGQDGKIIGMFWEACRFYVTFTSPQQGLDFEQLALFDLPAKKVSPTIRAEWIIRLAMMCLIIFRWYQSLKGNDFTWKLE